jgi:haloalkane dehalogenase
LPSRPKIRPRLAASKSHPISAPPISLVIAILKFREIVFAKAALVSRRSVAKSPRRLAILQKISECAPGILTGRTPILSGTELGRSDMISAAFPYQKQRRRVLGSEMAYVEAGQGDPIVLLHGNPTSSYLWRNVLPHLQPRCIAPDLIGMGDSDKLPHSGPGSYRFVEHRRYLDALLEALDVRERVTFVVHDWGSALGFDWANRHRDAVRGIAYMEAIAQPVIWDQWSAQTRAFFQRLRSPEGEQMILDDNLFVESLLPQRVLRPLTGAEMDAYRQPFREPGEARRPTLTWPRQLPIDGEPADVSQIVASYGRWLAASPVPKLFINADPGTISADERAFCRSWPNQAEVIVPGLHFLQEDSPGQIGQALARWHASLHP